MRGRVGYWTYGRDAPRKARADGQSEIQSDGHVPEERHRAARTRISQCPRQSLAACSGSTAGSRRARHTRDSRATARSGSAGTGCARFPDATRTRRVGIFSATAGTVAAHAAHAAHSAAADAAAEPVAAVDPR